MGPEFESGVFFQISFLQSTPPPSSFSFSVSLSLMADFQLSLEYLSQVEPVTQLRDEKLQHAISKLKTQGRCAYLRAAEKIIDPLSMAPTLGVGGLSSVALHECAFVICARYILGLLPSSEDTLLSLHLSENNGEFIDRVRQWCRQLNVGSHHWAATQMKGPTLPRVSCDPNGTILASINPGDGASTDAVLAQCLAMESPISIITADCEPTATEQEHIALFVQQVLIALEVLRDQGVLILKIAEFYHHLTKLMLWLLFSVFGAVAIVKPRATPLCDTSKYVLCQRFDRAQYLARFQALCAAIRADHNPSLVEFPLSWSYWLTARQNAFTVARESAQAKAVQVACMLAKKAPFLPETKLQELVETCWLDKNIHQFAQRYLQEHSGPVSYHPVPISLVPSLNWVEGGGGGGEGSRSPKKNQLSV